MHLRTPGGRLRVHLGSSAGPFRFDMPCTLLHLAALVFLACPLAALPLAPLAKAAEEGVELLQVGEGWRDVASEWNVP